MAGGFEMPTMAGIVEWLGRVGTLVIAVPIGFMGVDFLVNGRLALGLFLLSVAVAAVVLQEYVTRPGDLPGAVANRVVGSVAKTPEEED